MTSQLKTKKGKMKRKEYPRTLNGIVGIDYFARNDKWRARVNFGGAELWLGYHDTPEEAIKKVKLAKDIIKRHLFEIKNELHDLKIK